MLTTSALSRDLGMLSREECATIAVRSALRCVGEVFDYVAENRRAERSHREALLLVRALLSSVVTCVESDERIRIGALRRTVALRTQRPSILPNRAVNVVLLASGSHREVESVQSAVEAVDLSLRLGNEKDHEEVERDIDLVTLTRMPRLVFEKKLFQVERSFSLGLETRVSRFKKLADTEFAWSFWFEWVQGFVDGKPLDWGLQLRVALIPDEDWEQGPLHIAKKIEEVKSEYLASKFPQAETIEFNEDEGKFFTVPVLAAKPDLFGAALNQVLDALDDALANPSNGLSERSRETRVLRRTVAKYGNDPQRIEMDLTSVHAGLTRQMMSAELPPSEENLALQSACEEGARAVRVTHPEIAENRRILTEQAMRELSPEEKATLEEALPVLKAISRDDLAEEWEQDIPALVNDAVGRIPDTAPRLPGADEATRIFSRAAKISILLRTGRVIHAIDGSAGYKAARIATTIASLVGIGLAILAVIP